MTKNDSNAKPAAPKTPTEVLLSNIKERVKSFHKSSKRFKRKFYATTVVTIFLSAIITILSGFGIADIIPTKYFTITATQIILVLGVLITVVSAWGAMFSPKESWNLYANTVNNFRALQTEIEFESTLADNDSFDKAKMRDLHKRYQQIFDEHNEQWLELRKKDKQKPTSPQKPGV